MCKENPIKNKLYDLQTAHINRCVANHGGVKGTRRPAYDIILYKILFSKTTSKIGEFSVFLVQLF